MSHAAPPPLEQARVALDEMGYTDFTTRDFADHLGWTMGKAACVLRGLGLPVLVYAEHVDFTWHGCICIWGWSL